MVRVGAFIAMPILAAAVGGGIFAADPGAPPAIVVAGAARGSTPAWNADGRFLLYARALEPGQTAGEIRAIEVASGAERGLGRVACPADDLGDPAAARTAEILHPRAASADLAVVWLDRQGEGLWSWRPADGRLARRDILARGGDRGFSLATVAMRGPEGRLAFSGERGEAGVCAAGADSIAWLTAPELAGHSPGAVGWWREQLVEVMPDGHARILWPTAPAITAPVFAVDPPADAADRAAPLRGRDPSSGDQLTVSIAGNPDHTLAGLPSTRTVLALRDAAGGTRWTRVLDWSEARARAQAAVMAAEVPPGLPPERRQRYRNLWEEASVIAYRHPHALLQLSLCGWYGMEGKRVFALMGYDCEARRLTALDGDVHLADSGGVSFDRGALPECAADPGATAVAFRQGDRITVLRAPAPR